MELKRRHNMSNKSLKPNAVENEAMRQMKKKIPASPIISSTSSKKEKSRSYFSTFINLAALVALFTFVFAIQQLGNKASDDGSQSNNPPSEIAKQETATEQTRGAKDGKVKGAVYDLSTATDKQKGNSVKAVSSGKPKYAPSNKYVATRTQSRWWEDRRKSAQLVDQLDGNYYRRNRSTTNVNYTPSSPSPRATSATYRSHRTSDRAPYGSDLDDEVARQFYLSTNRATPSTNTGPIAGSSKSSPPPDFAISSDNSAHPQLTTASAKRTGRKPTWEVTGDR